MFTTARFAESRPARYSVTIGPRVQNVLPIWTAIPSGPAAFGRSVGWLMKFETRSPSPPTMSCVAPTIRSRPRRRDVPIG